MPLTLDMYYGKNSENSTIHKAFVFVYTMLNMRLQVQIQFSF